MLNLPVTATILALAATSLAAEDYTLHTFKKVQLTDQFWAEGATYGDFNHDGVIDIASGPFWYEGPDYKKRHEFYPATESFTKTNADGTKEKIPGYEGGLGIKNTYSENFFEFTYDFNGDGWPDIMVFGFPGKDAAWYENPKGREGHWQRHSVLDVVDNESPQFADVDGDGKPDIICNSGGFVGYATADWSNPAKPWKFHPISAKGGWQRFTHGIGIGDINGDGKIDFMLHEGWWEQPVSLANDPVWTFHPFDFGSGGAQMYAYDINGDGLPDVLTSLEAHGYGLVWFEQVKENNTISFKKHVIINKDASENRYGVHFSQLHGIDLVDMDGDGLKDIVTGKRFWAHGNEGDVEPNAPAVLYWFKLVRLGSGKVDFIPYQIDDNSGTGTQVMAGTVSNPKAPDVVVGNKKGVFLFKHETKTVSKAEWEKAQPKALDK